MNDLLNNVSRRVVLLTCPAARRLTSMGSISLAMEGERERDLMRDLGSSSRDGVLDGVKLSTEST